MKVGTIYNYADPSTKEEFAKKALAFLKKSAKLAGVLPDLKNPKASPVKRYPYYNKGGEAVLGDAYLNITKEGTVLEIIMGDSGLFYRTKKENQYGNNNWPCGFGREMRASDYDEEKLAGVITRFMAYEETSNLAFR